MKKGCVFILLFVILFLASTLLVGCHKQTPVSKVDDSPVTVNSSSPVKTDSLQTSEQKGTIYQVTKINSKLMTEPEDNSDTLVQLDIGIPVSIIEEYENGWYKVKLYKQSRSKIITGYLKNDSLQLTQLHQNIDFTWSKPDEAELIKKYPDFVERNDDTLILNLQNGKEIKLTDEIDIDYWLLDFKSNYFIIWNDSHAGSTYSLINRENGNQIEFHCDPLFSPDNKRFVITNQHHCLLTSTLLVYNVENDRPEIEFELHCANWTPSNEKWINTKEIEFTKNYYYGSRTLTESSDNNGYVFWKDRLKFDNEKWALRDTKRSSLIPEDLIKKAGEKGVDLDRLEMVDALGYDQEKILSLTSDKIDQILAPGNPELDEFYYVKFIPDNVQKKELEKIGIDPEMSAILYNLGYNYEEMLSLSSEEIDFIFPNTELVDNLVKKGFKKEQVQPWTIAAAKDRIYWDYIKEALVK